MSGIDLAGLAMFSAIVTAFFGFAWLTAPRMAQLRADELVRAGMPTERYVGQLRLQMLVNGSVTLITFGVLVFASPFWTASFLVKVLTAMVVGTVVSIAVTRLLDRFGPLKGALAERKMVRALRKTRKA